MVHQPWHQLLPVHGWISICRKRLSFPVAPGKLLKEGNVSRKLGQKPGSDQEVNDLLLLQEYGADIRCLAPEALEISEGWRRGGGQTGWIIRSLFTWGNSIVEGGGREICIPNTRTTYI